jgi:hypothetical protein
MDLGHDFGAPVLDVLLRWLFSYSGCALACVSAIILALHIKRPDGLDL